MDDQLKTYRAWDARQGSQQLISPSDVLPEDDLVFFLLDVVPQMDLSSDVRFQECGVVVVGAEPHDQRILSDADEHVAVEQEADSAEHPLFFDVPSAGKFFANAVGQFFIESHR